MEVRCLNGNIFKTDTVCLLRYVYVNLTDRSAIYTVVQRRSMLENSQVL